MPSAPRSLELGDEHGDLGSLQPLARMERSGGGFRV